MGTPLTAVAAAKDKEAERAQELKAVKSEVLAEVEKSVREQSAAVSDTIASLKSVLQQSIDKRDRTSSLPLLLPRRRSRDACTLIAHRGVQRPEGRADDAEEPPEGLADRRLRRLPPGSLFLRSFLLHTRLVLLAPIACCSHLGHGRSLCSGNGKRARRRAPSAGAPPLLHRRRRLRLCPQAQPLPPKRPPRFQLLLLPPRSA
jgi:hypothetical protein